MNVKRITIRVPAALHGQLEARAKTEKLSLNALATRALEAYVDAKATQHGRWPLSELSLLLAPAAAADEMDEAALLGYAREVRDHFWRDRYADPVLEQTPPGGYSPVERT